MRFYNVIPEVTYHHFYHLLLATQTNLCALQEGTTQWGEHQEAGILRNYLGGWLPHGCIESICLRPYFSLSLSSKVFHMVSTANRISKTAFFLKCLAPDWVWQEHLGVGWASFAACGQLGLPYNTVVSGQSYFLCGSWLPQSQYSRSCQKMHSFL